MRSHRKRIWKKHGHLWFCYLGKHRWYCPERKGRVFFYRKKYQDMWSPAPKHGGGLKGLKSFWRKRMKTKNYKQKGHFDFLSYYRSNGR